MLEATYPRRKRSIFRIIQSFATPPIYRVFVMRRQYENNVSALGIGSSMRGLIDVKFEMDLCTARNDLE